MVFHIITIFPDIFDSYFKKGVLRRAQMRKKIKIKIHNLRNFTGDAHGTIDDRPFGGGPGMVLKPEPIYKAIKKIKIKKKRRVILLSAKGRKFTQKTAKNFLKFDEIIFICGRYEGVDERIAKYIADDEISIGDYILSGGEIAAMVVIETVSRLIPGVLGNKESIEEKRSISIGSKIHSYPVYTRPKKIKINDKERKVPRVLLSGDHKKIEEWRKKQTF
jgi:tRNA (guanine37-N1)-methyltransferase